MAEGPRRRLQQERVGALVGPRAFADVDEPADRAGPATPRGVRLAP